MRRLRRAALALLLIAAHAGAQEISEPRGVRPGRDVELRGEVVELGCYLRDGSRGEHHKACAITCLKNGGPLALVEDETGLLHPLAAELPASDPSSTLRDHVAAHVAVRGRLYERAGSRVLVVQSVETLSE